MILGLSLTAHKTSIIFRRELAQMKGADGIIERSVQIVGDDDRLNRSDYVWRGLPGGRNLEFAGVPHEHSKNKYKGRPHDLKCFDELTEFTRSQYRFLIIWNRTSIPGQRCRVVATTNPPITDDESWVIDEWAPWLDPEFPDPAKPGEIRYYTYGKQDELLWFKEPGPVEIDGKMRDFKSRTFIPAKLSDNPYLVDTGYDKVLDALPAELREAFKEGDFKTGLAANPLQVIPTAWARAAQERWKKLQSEGFVPNVPMTAMGVDPSRGGRDSTVIVPRFGDYVPEIIEYPGKAVPDGHVAAGYMVAHHRDNATVIVDVIGYGASAYDSAKLSLPCVPFNASEKSLRRDSSGKFGFVNKRAAAYWHLREMLDPDSDYEVALPDNSRLRQELCAPTFKVVKTGIQIEPKDSIKERIGRSPDMADGVVYAFHVPHLPKRRVQTI